FRRLLVLASTGVTAAWFLFRKRRPEPGRFGRRIFVTRAGTRFYMLYLPSMYRGQSLPLVLMLHGCKQTPEDFAAGTRMNQAAEELRFIVAYPAQAWRANVDRCWNWFRERDQQRDHGEPAIMATTYPELYAAVGIHSGLPYASARGTATAAAAMRFKRLGAAAPLPVIPTIVFHGD